MTHFITMEDKKQRTERIANFLIDYKKKLDNPNFRTKHNLNRWKLHKNRCNKTLSSLGYKLNLETEVLRELIPMKIKTIDLDKQMLIQARDHLEMVKRKYINCKNDLQKAKQYYNILLKDYMEKNK